jgi:CBS domain-containing protein
MTTVRQLLDQKGGNTWAIHPDATVFDAVAKMAEKDIGSLVVMEGGSSWKDTSSLHGLNNPLTNVWPS